MAKIGEPGSARAMEIWLLPFAAMFTQPSWLNAVALATGALLCLNRRTVCAALRAVDGSVGQGVQPVPSVPVARGMVGPGRARGSCSACCRRRSCRTASRW